MLGIPYTIQEIAELGVALDLFQGRWPLSKLRYLSFDTRTIAHGAETVFIALKTPHRDGHLFAEQAYQKGVRNFIVDRPLPFRDINAVICDDTLAFVQRWAFHHRLRFSYPVVGITGSNGKTIVKEWAATLLEWELRLVKSPMSYNSQLGVALSLLHLHPQADLALIEAGVSQAGEMAALAGMIQPDWGVLTHMGSAHADGFPSEADKLTEKLQLFGEVEKVLAGSWQPEVQAAQPDLPWRTIGWQAGDQLRITRATEGDTGWLVTLEEDGKPWQLSVPLTGRANLENALLAVLVAREAGMAMEAIQSRLPLLRPVEMRTEIITDHPDITIINDAYNSDLDSIRNAFQALRQFKARPRHILVLSDIPHQGPAQRDIQQQVMQEACELVGKENAFFVGPVFRSMAEGAQAFETVEALQSAISVADWHNSTVLLKGARTFSLERLIPWLQRKPNAAFFRIDLGRLSHNLRWFRGKLPADTRTMAMVKAASYGGGTWEIAQRLASEGVDYLAVAYPSEGITLREAGIELPIMVMNPDPESMDSLVRYDLEPEISQLRVLDRYVQAAALADSPRRNIHIKLETGMGRLGLQEEQLPLLIDRLLAHPDLRVVSLMTHLAAADDLAEAAFTHSQVARFTDMARSMEQALGFRPWWHVVNTSGLLHFPEYAFDMVRLGLGLYGIDPTPDQAAGGNLLEIGSLHAFISQIASHPAGTSIGYGRSQVTTRPTRIATLPIGYADGYFRSLGNGAGQALLHGRLVPTFGRVCMDMLMLDVTDVPEARAGDEVVLFGSQGAASLSVTEVAKAAGTIPYELLVRISPRVRRIFETGG